jgi:muramoyltetrapeptide carboxypeptidase
MNRKAFLHAIIPASLGIISSPKGFAASKHPHKTAIPRYLHSGDTIAITCPASPMEAAEATACIQMLQSWGFKVKIGHTLNKKWQHFGGTDEERAQDMQALIDDETVSAIMFARGGYGVMRMMDKLNWKQFTRHPKWLIGFSDITAFHCHLNTRFGIPSIHADMAGGFGNTEDPSATSIKNILRGKKIDYEFPGCHFNRTGTATGLLVGGNLSLIYALQASKSELKTDGKILFIEDVGEYNYTVDRMLMNLKRSGKLDNLAGLLVGGFTNMKVESKHEFTMLLEEIIYEKVKEYNYPVCFEFPAGHQKTNWALKLGMPYKLEVNKSKCWLVEQGQPPLSAIKVPRLQDRNYTDTTELLSREVWD